MRFEHLKSRIFNTPLMIHPDKLLAIYNALAPRFGAERIETEAQVTALQETGPRRRSYQLAGGGVAVIPVVGTLVQREGGLEAVSGLMSYAAIGRRLEEALEDDQVKAILLEVDSPGGEVAGVFALAERIVKAREIKPVWAVANEMAFSAGYALACAAQRIYLPKTAELGSIGVIAWHVDQSAFDEKTGIKWTPVFAGRHKADYSAHAPLSDEARARLQKDIDTLYEIFVGAVAKNRGLDPVAVRATEALTYLGEAAVAAGLADGVMAFDQIVGMLADQAGGKTVKEKPYQEGRTMPNEPTDQAVRTAGEERSDLESLKAEARQAARERIKAILGCSEAEGRRELAEHLAFNTEMDPKEARGLLALAPKAGQADPGAEFRRAMAAEGDKPNVAPDVDRSADGEIRPGAMAASMKRVLLRRGLKPAEAAAV